jgi:sulfide dehydrogenase cytochrome subunit
VVLLGSTPTLLAEGITRGAMLANGCAGCHGTDGRGSGRIPRINDLPKPDMVDIMKGFRDGLGRPTVMDRHAKGYTDEEVGLIADYYASMKKK